MAKRRTSGLSKAGRYSHLARKVDSLCWTDSPAIATHDKTCAATKLPDEALGGMIADEPRNHLARTPKSGV